SAFCLILILTLGMVVHAQTANKDFRRGMAGLSECNVFSEERGVLNSVEVCVLTADCQTDYFLYHSRPRKKAYCHPNKSNRCPPDFVHCFEDNKNHRISILRDFVIQKNISPGEKIYVSVPDEEATKILKAAK